MQKLLGSGNPKSSARESVDVAIGRYVGLQLVITGTTDSGETLDEADIGRIRVQRGSRQIQGETFEFYHDYSNLKGGHPSRVVPTADASRIVAFIPFQFPGIPNAIDVRNKEELDVYLDFDGVLDTRFGSNAARWELYGIMDPAIPERYELRIDEQDIQASGEGRMEDVLNGRNLGALYLRDGSSVVDTVQLEVDGRTVVDTIDDEALLDLTTLNNRIEGSGFGLIEINLGTSGALGSIRNSNAELSVIFSGAGTLEVTKLRVEPSDRAAASIADVEALLGGAARGLARPRSRPANAVR